MEAERVVEIPIEPFDAGAGEDQAASTRSTRTPQGDEDLFAAHPVFAGFEVFFDEWDQGASVCRYAGPTLPVDLQELARAFGPRVPVVDGIAMTNFRMRRSPA
jgi:hypothetical protein